MEKIYIVKIHGGDYEDRFTYTIFATSDKTKAEKYVEKYNRLLQKLQNHYDEQIKTLEENGCEESQEYGDIYNKSYHVGEYKFCSMEELEVR